MELTPAQWAALGSGLFLPFSTAKNGVSSCSLWGFVAQRLLHVLCHSSLGRHRPVRDCFHKLVDYLWDGSRVVEPLPVPRLYWCHGGGIVKYGIVCNFGFGDIYGFTSNNSDNDRRRSDSDSWIKNMCGRDKRGH